MWRVQESERLQGELPLEPLSEPDFFLLQSGHGGFGLRLRRRHITGLARSLSLVHEGLSLRQAAAGRLLGTRQRPRSLGVLTTRSLGVLAARSLGVLTTRSLSVLTTRSLGVLTTRGLSVLATRSL